MSYQTPGPTREEIDGSTGPVLLDFGTDWCGYCQAAAPKIAEALSAHPTVRRLQVEDGPGRRLGRSFRVKLWPTLIALIDAAGNLFAPGRGRDYANGGLLPVDLLQLWRVRS